MRLMLPFKMHRLAAFCTEPRHPREWVRGERHVTEREMLVRRDVWARYNRKARAAGRRPIVESR